MIFYRVMHQYRLDGHPERKDIGLYSSEEAARTAIESLKTQDGFRDTPNGFRIKKVFRLFKPKLADKTFWNSGFFTYRS